MMQGHPGVARLAAALALACAPALSTASPMVIAPLIEGAHYCLSAVEAGMDPAAAERHCREQDESPSARLEQLLAQFSPAQAHAAGPYVMGYTHALPLLKYLRRQGDGWVVDSDSLQYAMRPIAEVERPVVLYLFANHFGVDYAEDSFETLAAAHEPNLMRFADGRIAQDSYFNSRVTPWSISDLQAPINQERGKVLQAVIEALCALPPEAQERIVALNLLGEVHHLFPNFHDGMGFEAPMVTTDYSEPSVQGFRRYLQARFTSIGALNRQVGSSFRSFADIEPPSKDMFKEPLKSFTEHLDVYAHGRFPVLGWVAAPELPVHIDVYLNGALAASGPANQNRQDVLDAKPELGTANVGFRFDIPYGQLPPGIHSLSIRASSAGKSVELTRRSVVIMDRLQSEPAPIPSHPLPDIKKVDQQQAISGWADYPRDLQPLFYNPLAELWLDFRNQQVVQYLDHYADIAAAGCFPREKIFSHQIAPNLNASWNGNLMAADASLRATPAYGFGVNLYGGAASGEHFHQWLGELGVTRYAVPEFHPMQNLSTAEVAALLEKHRQAGAVYIAPYYITSIPPQFSEPSDHNKFRISPDNNDYGSASFYQGLRAVFEQQPR